MKRAGLRLKVEWRYRQHRLPAEARTILGSGRAIFAASTRPFMAFGRPLITLSTALLLVLAPGFTPPARADSFPDSTALHRNLPDSTRLRLLARLSSAYGPSSPPRCIHYGLLGLPLARKLKDGDTELGLLDNLAVSYARSGSLPDALRYYLQELQRAQQLGDRRYELAALSGLGNVQGNEGNYREAEATFRRALAMALNHNDTLALARTRNQLGSFLLERHRYAEAEPLLREALQAFELLGRIYEQGDCLNGLAETALGQQQPAAGLAYGKRALALMTQKGDAYGMAWANALLCRAAAALGQLNDARQYGAAAIAHSRAIPGTEAAVLPMLVAAFRQERAWADAFPLQERLTFLQDSFYTITRATEMARLQTQFETHKKQQAIVALTQRARLQQAQAERDALRFRLLAVGTVALLIVLALLVGLLRRLRQTSASLRRSNKMKDQLLSIVGHDLRGPVVAFQQVGEVLRYYAETPDPTELRELANELEQGATNLAGLLDNLLHWARAQMDEVVNRPTQLEAARVIENVVRLYRPAALAKHVTLRAEVLPQPDSRPTEVWADATLLETVLRNLVSNAVKFTPTGGTVTVTAEAQHSRVTFQVIDTGVGMTPEAAAALFEPAVAPTRGTAGEVGTGLGVAVCRQFVSLLGGELHLRTAPQKGTCFSFQLPIPLSRQETNRHET